MAERSTERPTKYGTVPIEAAVDAALTKEAYRLREMERSKKELVELVNR